MSWTALLRLGHADSPGTLTDSRHHNYLVSAVPLFAYGFPVAEAATEADTTFIYALPYFTPAIRCDFTAQTKTLCRSDARRRLLAAKGVLQESEIAEINGRRGGGHWPRGFKYRFIAQSGRYLGAEISDQSPRKWASSVGRTRVFHCQNIGI